jgi:PAS domain S-box-containing protein
VGRNLADLLAPQVGGTLLEAMEQVARTGLPVTITRHRGAASRERWLEATLIPAPCRSQIFVVVHDVTECHRAIEMLRESEDRHRTVLDQMQEAVVFADENNVVRHINAFACRYLNTTWEGAVGKDLRAFHSPETYGKVEQVIATFRSDPDSHVVMHQRALGDREMIFRFSAVRDGDGHYRGVIANLIDVTENRRLEARLRQASQMEVVGRLAGGVAHDVNNMMVSVIGLASLVRCRLGGEHPEAEQLLEIEKAGERASELANQLVAFARTGDFRPRAVNLNELVQRVTGPFSAGMPKRTHAELDLAPNLPDVHADVRKMEQVVLNLCRNGLEALKGHGRLRIGTAMRRLTDGDASLPAHLRNAELVCLFVQDDGCGMDAQTAAKVFEPFFSGRPGARGMGLAYVPPAADKAS